MVPGFMSPVLAQISCLGRNKYQQILYQERCNTYVVFSYPYHLLIFIHGVSRHPGQIFAKNYMHTVGTFYLLFYLVWKIDSFFFFFFSLHEFSCTVLKK